jgi:hypothetical protein
MLIVGFEIGRMNNAPRMDVANNPFVSFVPLWFQYNPVSDSDDLT